MPAAKILATNNFYILYPISRNIKYHPNYLNILAKIVDGNIHYRIIYN